MADSAPVSPPGGGAAQSRGRWGALCLREGPGAWDLQLDGWDAWLPVPALASLEQLWERLSTRSKGQLFEEKPPRRPRTWGWYRPMSVRSWWMRRPTKGLGVSILAMS